MSQKQQRTGEWPATEKAEQIAKKGKFHSSLITDTPALARVGILKNLPCRDRLHLLLSGKGTGNMDSSNSIIDISKHLENCHLEMALPVTLWNDSKNGAWFVHEGSLAHAFSNLELRVSEGAYNKNLALDVDDVKAFKKFKSYSFSHSLQVKNAHIYEHTSGLAFKMSAIRFEDRIYPITQTLLAISTFLQKFQKVEFQTPIESDKRYVECEILLTGPGKKSWSEERMLEFDSIIPNFGQDP